MLRYLIQTPLATALGHAIFDSLWQGAAAALLLAATLGLARRSAVRYVLACAAMGEILLGFLWTLFEWLPGGLNASTAAGLPAIQLAGANAGAIAAAYRFRPEDLLPWLAPLWMAGITAFSLRGLADWRAALRWRGRGVCGAPKEWQRRLDRLRKRARVSQPVALLESCLAEVPAVIGHFRPVILVPVGLLAGMPASQVEAILLHELAHIRRRDYLVNLLQIAVEGILFYHPAVWWISKTIRTERENCCDDFVVAEKGNPHEYATALAALEQTRWSDETALAATGGNLMKRVRRLLNPHQRPYPALMPVFFAGVLIAAVAFTAAAWQGQPSPSGPYAAWEKNDVAYIITSVEQAAFERLRTDQERDAFIAQFWLSRDPTPGTARNEFKEEHYRRIAYANELYADAAEGWKSDRGRMYITFGPPDEIESHPSGDSAAKNFPYEQWLYRHIEGVGERVIIEFEDRERTGKYRMTKDPNP